jgi:alkylation response protein AidB-like acyl-CoA dehydrogenase
VGECVGAEAAREELRVERRLVAGATRCGAERLVGRVDTFSELELCKSVVLAALSACDEKRADLALTASAAKTRLCDASRRITREAIQLHGGIGMTDEHDIGFYLKRGSVAELTFGDSSYHRDRYAKLKGF